MVTILLLLMNVNINLMIVFNRLIDLKINKNFFGISL